MIQYSLKCENAHRFDSWFQSAAAFDKLQAVGHVTCAFCGSDKVEKAIMAPRVQSARKAASAPTETDPNQNRADTRPPAAGALHQSGSEVETALRALKRQVEANSEYVGDKFAAEARAMHDGHSPERAIYGEAKLEDAKKLIDDGVPVTPLPFLPGRKSN